MASKVSVGSNMPQRHACLVQLPVETRLAIYALMHREAQYEPRHWQHNHLSSYAGLLLTCKSLGQEARDHLFFGIITQHQMDKLHTYPTNKHSFLQFRSLKVEVGFVQSDQVFSGLARVLHRFQLSLQELGLFFCGQDTQGNYTSVSGCGKMSEWANNCEDVLPEKNQQIEKKMIVLRQLPKLRNLRVLQVENANMPLIHSMFMINKQHLQAVSVRSDPRSILHGYGRFTVLERRRILKGLLQPIDHQRMPPITALEIDANSTTTASDIVQFLAPSLRHLSWRVPNAGYQSQSLPYNRFYELTNSMMQTLVWRAPDLETLRLCIEPQNLPANSDIYRSDVSNIVGSLSTALPRLGQLLNFELHYTGGEEFNFLRHHLIAHLPPTLKRLYISELTLEPLQLVSQIYARYLTSVNHSAQSSYYSTHYDASSLPADHDDDHDNDHDHDHDHRDSVSAQATLSEANLRDIPIATAMFINAYGHIEYKASSAEHTSSDILVARIYAEASEMSDYLDFGDFHCGEARHRQDQIPLDTGKLAFVTFEYTSVDGEEAERISILRMNGRLLDREHNMHLASPVTMKRVHGNVPYEAVEHSSDISETSASSAYPLIDVALFNASQAASNEDLIDIRSQDLKQCKVLQEDTSDWYFGREDEAHQAFNAEQVAKSKDQRKKPSTVGVDVEIPHRRRCRWMCPDAIVDPVGCFEEPPIPVDWSC